MTTFILSAVCAIALNATAAPVDTVDTYIVNGDKIENFSGSQLEGKIVTRYTIGRVKGKAERVHIITTKGTTVESGSKSTIVLSPAAATASVVIIDGKKESHEALATLSPEKIKNITVLKGDKAVKVYGEEAREGVVIVTTKKGTNNICSDIPLSGKIVSIKGNDTGNDVHVVDEYTISKDKVVYILNGKEITKEKFDKISPQNIKSMTVVKGKENVKKYTDKDCSVILITTKHGNS